MLSTLNKYAHGVVAVPTIVACRKLGLFAFLDDRGPTLFATLARDLNANPGQLRVALRLLESLGWIYRDASSDTYGLVSAADILTEIPTDVQCLLDFSVEDYLDESVSASVEFARLRALSENGWNTRDSTLATLLDGCFILPLLLHLKRRGDLELPLLASRSETSREELLAFFANKGWCERKGDGYSPTLMGQRIFDRVEVSAVTCSYRPMLKQLEALLTGECRDVFGFQDDGDEKHIDRQLNVIGSGFQHGRYFDDLMDVIVDIFNTPSIDEQPKYIADTGCGDGTLLREIYRTIESKTARGRVLADHPVTLVGIDYNEVALREAEKTLRDLEPVLLKGDIGDPERILADLRDFGVASPDEILHVRSFLDHDRRYTPPKDADSIVSRTFLQGLDAGAVDHEGREIPASSLYQSLVEHLQLWAGVIGTWGLLMLEVHRVEPTIVASNLDSECLHFDALHGFSRQMLVSAEHFLMAAAEAGLFPKPEFVKKYPKAQSFARITLNCFERRHYRIRHARIADLDALMELENRCWIKELRTRKEIISDRILNYPEGQLILEVAGVVKGSIYSQRIDAVESLDDRTVDTADDLHRSGGGNVQLHALNISPDVQDQKLGDQLLEFMLQRCALLAGVEKVVGVTRCRDFDRSRNQSLEDYVKINNENGIAKDPILGFHDFHGAKIEKIVNGYRPKDHKNLGCGVLISYDVMFRKQKIINDSLSSGMISKIDRHSEDKISSYMRKMVALLRGNVDEGMVDIDRPLMQLGLDSADLLELSLNVAREFQLSLPPPFFFENNTISKAAAALVTKFSDRSRATAEVAGSVERPVRINPPSRENFDISQHLCSDSDIAVIGLSGRYPGSHNIDQFWENLRSARDCVTEIPRERWKSEEFFDEKKGKLDSYYCQWGGFLTGLDHFDPLFFSISPAEAVGMDPREMLFLEAVWTLFESSGYTRDRLASEYGGGVGLFVGAMGGIENGGKVPRDPSRTRSLAGSIANRVSHFFGLRGASMVVDTMCSSAMTAIHLACRDLLSGDSDLAVAGAVNVSLQPAKYVDLCKSEFLGSSFESRTFADGDGYLPAEGVGAVLLKRLPDAVRDGDPVLALIKATAVSHCGSETAYGTANLNAQVDLFSKVLSKAGYRPDQISYIEVAGSGEALADAIELSALEKVFGDTADRGALPIGSVKSLIGHAEAASGLSQLTKVVLQLHHGQLVPNPVPRDRNSNVDWEQSSFRIQQTVEELTSSVVDSEKCDASNQGMLINSFGMGGTYSAAVLEGYEAPFGTSKPAAVTQSDAEHIIVLSAQDEGHLRVLVEQLLQHVDANPGIVLADLAYTLQVGREAMAVRVAWVVSSYSELLKALAAFLASRKRDPGDALLTSSGRQDENPLFKTLLSDDAAGIMARVLLEQGEHKGVSLLWEQGARISWAQIYDKRSARILRLPTYPFRQECLSEKALSASSRPPFDAITGVNAMPSEARSNGESAVQTFVTEFLCRELAVPLSSLDLERPFRAYGADSLICSRLLRALDEVFSIKVTGRQFLEAPTIIALIRYLEGRSESGKTTFQDALELPDYQDWLMQRFLEGEIDLADMGRLIEQGSVL